MYPLGILFGLGFDTSSQVALLGISAVQSAAGTSIWLMLLFPLLFTVGMCLIDNTDGALMLALYTIGTQDARTPVLADRGIFPETPTTDKPIYLTKSPYSLPHRLRRIAQLRPTRIQIHDDHTL